MDKEPLEALREACFRAGSQSALARILDVDVAAISQWKSKRIPAERVLPIERATGVRRERLRPDLYPHD